MSFESSAHPGLYLRACDELLYLEASDGSQSFMDQATFVVQETFFDGFASFESTDQPGYYLRHGSNTLRLKDGE